MPIQINATTEITNSDNVNFNGQNVLEVYLNNTKVFDKERWRVIAENLEFEPNVQTSATGTWTDDIFNIPNLLPNLPTRITCTLSTRILYVGGSSSRDETFDDSLTDTNIPATIKRGESNSELLKLKKPTISGQLPYSVYGSFTSSVGIPTLIYSVRPLKFKIIKIEQYY